jgi:ABC-type bacteriocin/lantibiotic exporter with double-glycine peptidase domain
LALIALLRQLGRPPSPDEAERLIAVAGTEGTDLRQSKELAKHSGLYAVGVEISLADLRKSRRLAIAHLNGVSFAAILGYEPDGVVVAYPDEGPRIVPGEISARQGRRC